MDGQGKEEVRREEKTIEVEDSGNLSEKPKKDFPYAKVFSLAMMGLFLCWGYFCLLDLDIPMRKKEN